MRRHAARPASWRFRCKLPNGYCSSATTASLSRIIGLTLLRRSTCAPACPSAKFCAATSTGYFQAPTATVPGRSEEHTSELQSLMHRSYAVFCLKYKYRGAHHKREDERDRNSTRNTVTTAHKVHH